ncbi:NAD(P)H-dependent flavin oxidoreductase [Terricaulis sp.]|uniref:NAD(P)H-dependent flavin oxidoreductase n=1 Tax=Terricaulis sp. TaxID=2768686 RepID=UPI003782D7BA
MLAPDIRHRLTLPAICAPMMQVSGPELVAEACIAGLMAGLPTHNARDIAEFETWLSHIETRRKAAADAAKRTPRGVLAVNLSGRRTEQEIEAYLSLCARHGVEVIISAMGNPAALTARAHAHGMRVFHDIVSIAHAEKAIAAGVDGLTCIGAGGGGHSGALSPFALIPRVREMFSGAIIMAGAAASGAAIRAAEVLGADLCYLGTRFIATVESRAPTAYKEMLVNAGASDIIYTPRITGVAANWLKPSLLQHALDPENLPQAAGPRSYEHLPPDVRPWRDIWSAGHGAELIRDIPSVADLVARLRAEYITACELSDMRDAAAVTGHE